MNIIKNSPFIWPKSSEAVIKEKRDRIREVFNKREKIRELDLDERLEYLEVD
jgi:hypothetical protein